MTGHVSRLRPIALLLVAAALALAGCGTDQTQQTGTGNAAPRAGASASDSASTPSSEALAFTGATLDGAQLDASTLTGQPVVLWFWAPWCTICRAEAPDVAAIAAEFDGQVTFLGIPGRGPEADMLRFVDETGTTGFDHVVDEDGSLWQRFGVVAQPSFVFVASDGTAETFAGSLPAEELRQVASTLATG